MWTAWLGALMLVAAVVLVYTAATTSEYPGSADPVPGAKVRERRW